MPTVTSQPPPRNHWLELASRADLDPLRSWLCVKHYDHAARTTILHQAAVSRLGPGCLAGLVPEFLDPPDLIGAEGALAECRDLAVGDFLTAVVPVLEERGWTLTGFDSGGCLLSYQGRTIRVLVSDASADDLTAAPAGRLSAAETAARNAGRVS